MRLLTYQFLLFAEGLCPTFEDVEGCQEGLQWWPQIAPKIFAENEAKYVCKSIDSSCEFSAKTWDCETCVSHIFDLSRIMSSETAAANVVNDLSGPYFCQSLELDLDEIQIEVCRIYINDFIPKALQLLFPLPLVQDAEDSCSYYFGLCNPLV